MAIQLVGFQDGGRAGNVSTESTNYALTGGLGETVPAAGDFVLIGLAVATQGRTPSTAILTAGFANLGQVFADGTTYDTRLNINYKFMDSTPDTAFLKPSTGHIDDAQAYTVIVYRGVDPATPFDVTDVSATGTGTARPDCPAITPITTGAMVWVVGAGAAATMVTITSPGGVGAFQQALTADVNDIGIASCQVANWVSGAVDTAAFGGGSTNAADSWAAYAVALRPADVAAAGGLLVLG